MEGGGNRKEDPEANIAKAGITKLGSSVINGESAPRHIWAKTAAVGAACTAMRERESAQSVRRLSKRRRQPIRRADGRGEGKQRQLDTFRCPAPTPSVAATTKGRGWERRRPRRRLRESEISAKEEGCPSRRLRRAQLALRSGGRCGDSPLAVRRLKAACQKREQQDVGRRARDGRRRRWWALYPTVPVSR